MNARSLTTYTMIAPSAVPTLDVTGSPSRAEPAWRLTVCDDGQAVDVTFLRSDAVVVASGFEQNAWMAHHLPKRGTSLPPSVGTHAGVSAQSLAGFCGRGLFEDSFGRPHFSTPSAQNLN